jgi:hypothetical protein
VGSQILYNLLREHAPPVKFIRSYMDVIDRFDAITRLKSTMPSRTAGGTYEHGFAEQKSTGLLVHYADFRRIFYTS